MFDFFIFVQLLRVKAVFCQLIWLSSITLLGIKCSNHRVLKYMVHDLFHHHFLLFSINIEFLFDTSHFNMFYRQKLICPFFQKIPIYAQIFQMSLLKSRWHCQPKTFLGSLWSSSWSWYNLYWQLEVYQCQKWEGYVKIFVSYLNK